MWNREFSETSVSPKASRQGITNDILQFPRGCKSSSYDIPIGGHRIPQSADASRSGEIWNRKILEDKSEDIPARKRRENRTHGWNYSLGFLRWTTMRSTVNENWRDIWESRRRLSEWTEKTKKKWIFLLRPVVRWERTWLNYTIVSFISKRALKKEGRRMTNDTVCLSNIGSNFTLVLYV